MRLGLALLMALAAGPVFADSFSALRTDTWQVGDEQTSIYYDQTTGELAVDAPASTNLTSINIDSESCIFTGDPPQNLGGSFDNDTDCNIFKATFGSSFGSLSFGNVVQPGLSWGFVANDLTVVGSLEGGGGLGDVDCCRIGGIPEPATFILAALGLIGFIVSGRQTRRHLA